MSRPNDGHGLSGNVHDTARERRHQKRIDKLPFVLRQIDDAARHPTPTIRPDEPKALTGEELETLQRLLCRLRPTESHPFPDDWPALIARVMRLTNYLQHP